MWFGALPLLKESVAAISIYERFGYCSPGGHNEGFLSDVGTRRRSWPWTAGLVTLSAIWRYPRD